MFDFKHISPGYRSVPFEFENSQAQERFEATQRTQGRIILYELLHLVREMGFEVQTPETSRSKFTPEMLEKPLEKYFTPPVMNYDSNLLYQAVRKVSRMFYVGKLRPSQLGIDPVDPSTSSGAPLFERKGDVLLIELKRARAIMRGMCPPPVTVFHRGKNDEEARPVFGYPMAMTLLENMFFKPYQRQLVRQHGPYVGGRTNPQLGGDVNELRWKSRWLLELDYSKFDGSISSTLIHLAFGIIEENFEMSEREAAVWNKVKTYFITCPVLLPNGQLLLGKRHGVPSGSAFTQLVDSIVNAICIQYAILKLGVRTSRFYVMGDDSIIGVRFFKPNVQQWANAISELGITVNLEKSRVIRSTDDPYFLGHHWARLVGERDRNETWTKILTPERVDRRWKQGRDARIDYYLERISAYRVDNPAMWAELTSVMLGLEGKLFKPSDKLYAFKAGPSWNERSKFDPVARAFVSSAKKCKAVGTMLYYLRAVPPSEDLCAL
jgi:hypothetical protein